MSRAGSEATQGAVDSRRAIARAACAVDRGAYGSSSAPATAMHLVPHGETQAAAAEWWGENGGWGQSRACEGCGWGLGTCFGEGSGPRAAQSRAT